jgi:hypothetical protein
MKFYLDIILEHMYFSGVVLFIILISARVPDWLWYQKFLNRPYTKFIKSYTRPNARTSQLKYKLTNKSDSLLAFFRTYDTPSLKNIMFEINKKILIMDGYKHLVNYFIGVSLPLIALLLAGSDFISEFISDNRKVLLVEGISFILFSTIVVAFVDFFIELYLKKPLKLCILAIEEILPHR